MRSLVGVLTLLLFSISLLLLKSEVPANVKTYIKVVNPISVQEGAQPDNASKLRSWFAKYKCPLGIYSDSFIEQSHVHNLDYRLLPAISFRESTCGLRPTDNNSLGFGNYSFSGKEAIEYVAQAISGEGTKDGKYYMKAKKDPKQILKIYNTHPSYPAEVLDIMETIK